jgi:folate-dependent phosphoribosylglycinamide formyltransferase PurN
MTKWITFFSQTGSEIVELSQRLNRIPDVIVTNERPTSLRTIHPGIFELVDKGAAFHTMPNKPWYSDYEQILEEHLVPSDNYIITLHGWLRIFPGTIIKQYEHIYNGHPGLITKYPQLKGKDPQAKAFHLGLPESGCVIHKVTPGVDEGPVMFISQEIMIAGLTLDETYRKLHKMSIQLWRDYLKRNWNFQN